MARKLTDTGTTTITDIVAGDLLYVVRPSLGASGSMRIAVEDLIQSLDELFERHIYVIAGQMLEPQPPSAIIVAPHVPPVDITIPSLGNPSAGKALIAASAATTLSIQKNGSEVGQINIAGGGTVPTFDFPSDVTLTGQVDYLTVVNSASPDPTLGLFGFTIYARRA